VRQGTPHRDPRGGLARTIAPHPERLAWWSPMRATMRFPPTRAAPPALLVAACVYAYATPALSPTTDEPVGARDAPPSEALPLTPWEREPKPTFDLPGVEPGGWPATPAKADGLALGAFASEQAPGDGHPMCVIASLGWSEAQLHVVAIDVATVHEVSRTEIGPASGAWIAAVPSGVVVAAQRATSLDLIWVDASNRITARRSLPGLGAPSFDLRGFDAFDDRIVLASGGGGTTDLTLLDERGSVVGRHACHGGLFRPGPATFARHGEHGVLVNMLRGDAGRPVCSFSTRGAPRWRDVTLAAGAAGDDPLAGDDGMPGCTRLTGTVPWQEGRVGGAIVVHMVACCGDSGGGLFVCLPFAPWLPREDVQLTP